MPNGKWARKLIQIDTDCGLVKIPARTLGPLAVHFGIGSQSEKISISHVGTGRRIASTSSEEAAQQIAEALAELDWQMLQTDSLPPGAADRGVIHTQTLRIRDRPPTQGLISWSGLPMRNSL